MFHLKKQLSNILILVILTSYLSSCDAVKRVAKNEHLLNNTTINVNQKKNNTETINNLLYQKPNRKILGIPLRLHIYNLARKNRDSLFEAWLDKKPNRRSRLERRYSKKQIDKLKSSMMYFRIFMQQRYLILKN